HAPSSQRPRERLLECFAALRFGLALLDLLLELARQLELHADHADQNQHERAEQHGHQIAESSPDRRGCFHAAVDFVAHTASAPAVTRCAASSCRSSTICFCDITLRSTTSRACAT